MCKRSRWLWPQNKKGVVLIDRTNRSVLLEVHGQSNIPPIIAPTDSSIMTHFVLFNLEYSILKVELLDIQNIVACRKALKWQIYNHCTLPNNCSESSKNMPFHLLHNLVVHPLGWVGWWKSISMTTIEALLTFLQSTVYLIDAIDSFWFTLKKPHRPKFIGFHNILTLLLWTTYFRFHFDSLFVIDDTLKHQLLSDPKYW